MAKRRKSAKRRTTKRRSTKRKTARRAKGTVPVKILNKRLVSLNNLLTRRKGGKSYSGNPT